MTLNRERFQKVIALAESDNDNEALAAVRKARDMAREAGMSLGEAIGSRPGDGLAALAAALDRTKSAASDYLQNAKVAKLEVEVATLRAQLSMKLNQDDRYQQGRKEGYREGQKAAAQQFANTDAFRAGYRHGFAAGEESERSATNRAYDRGFADGKASVNPTVPGSRRTRKAAGGVHAA